MTRKRRAAPNLRLPRVKRRRRRASIVRSATAAAKRSAAQESNAKTSAGVASRHMEVGRGEGEIQ